MNVLKKLAIMYESITTGKISGAKGGEGETYGEAKANALTGFGGGSTCVLCKDAQKKANGRRSCPCCGWLLSTNKFCTSGGNAATYHGIEDAQNSEDLKKAFKARAKHIRKVLKKEV